MCTPLRTGIKADNPRTGLIAKLDVLSDQGNRNTTAIQDSIKKYTEWSVAQANLQLAANHNELLSKIVSIQTKLASSYERLQATSHRLILEGIAFPDMDTRLGQIEDQGQAEGTFEWLINDDKIPKSQQGALSMSFRQWLSDDCRGIFHITGKPGSGKSTLMRFLNEHPETRAQLRKWAAEGGDNSEPVISAVFFWNAGSRSQKSMNGLYRTLLHGTLKSHHEDLIPLLFPDRLVRLTSDLLHMSQGARGEKMPDREVAAAFLKLLGGTVSRLRFCLFIDGADEFSDPNVPQWSLARDIKTWVNSNPTGVKICVSSREEQPWLDSFNNCPRLVIHLTTDPDIRKMICNAIGDHPNFEVFDPGRARSFVDKFVGIAEGVFLWAKLVLVSVVEMLDYKKDIEDLEQALETYPPELDGLFDKIMRDKVRNNEEALTILKIIIELKRLEDTIDGRHALKDSEFEHFEYSLVKDALSGRIQCTNQWPKEVARGGHRERTDKFITSLPLLFGGLVVLTSKYPMRLDFNHRSVHQYLAANLQVNSLDKARIRLTVLQCLVANMREDLGGIGTYNQFDDHDTRRLATLIMWIGELDEITQQSCFPWLEEMEQHLFRLSDTSLLRWPDVDTSEEDSNPEEDPNPNSKLDLEARRGPCWILVLSVFCDLASYTEWALSRSTCTATWLTTIQAQAATFDFFLYIGLERDFIFRNGWSPLRILFLERPDGRRIIDPNGVFSTRSCGQVSIWQYFLIRMTVNEALFRSDVFPRVWDAVGIFLESGSRPGIYISWTVDETHERARVEYQYQCADDPSYPAPLCLTNITVMFSNSPAQEQERIRSHRNRVADWFLIPPPGEFRTEHDSTLARWQLELLKREIPYGGSLRDIFLLFGPKDRSDIQKLLEAEEPVRRDGANGAVAIFE